MDDNDVGREKDSKNKIGFFESYKNVIISIILFLMSLINVTDRFIISSVIIDIENYFGVAKSSAGLLQTYFLLVYMAFSPINGYLGDRINRKYLLIASILICLTSTIGGSFVNSNQYPLFVLSRCLFGISTASFETIAVPIIGDAYANNKKGRTITLILFMLGAPFGYGLGYFIGIVAKEIQPNDWRLAMRFTPFILVVILIAILIAYKEPPRGGSTITSLKVNVESDEIVESKASNPKKTYINDLKILSKNKTFVILTLSWIFALTTFIGFTWWSAAIMDYSLNVSNINKKTIETFKKFFSLSQALSGLVGIAISSKLSDMLKKKGIQKADCYLLALGFFLSTLFIYIYVLVADLQIYVAFISFSLLMVAFNFGFVLQAQVLLDIVEPNLRSTANSLIICLLHLVGDSISPYWIGLIQDDCLNMRLDLKNTYNYLTHCTKLSLYPLTFISFFSAAFALFSSLTYDNDKIKL